MHPRKPIFKYAGGAATSGGIVLIQKFLQLNFLQSLASSIASL